MKIELKIKGEILELDPPNIDDVMSAITRYQYADDCILNGASHGEIWEYMADKYIEGYKRALSDLEDKYNAY